MRITTETGRNPRGVKPKFESVAVLFLFRAHQRETAARLIAASARRRPHRPNGGLSAACRYDAIEVSGRCVPSTTLTNRSPELWTSSHCPSDVHCGDCH